MIYSSIGMNRVLMCLNRVSLIFRCHSCKKTSKLFACVYYYSGAYMDTAKKIAGRVDYCDFFLQNC